MLKDGNFFIDFSRRTDKHYYLCDLFDHDPAMPHHAMPEHSKQLYEATKNRFKDFNNARAEIGALEVLFDRMVPGAVLVLDDYGWLAYRAQKEAEDPWFEKIGYRVL
jgi:hypothetical protein